jgi:hypothetical protein
MRYCGPPVPSEKSRAHARFRRALRRLRCVGRKRRKPDDASAISRTEGCLARWATHPLGSDFAYDVYNGQYNTHLLESTPAATYQFTDGQLF